MWDFYAAGGYGMHLVSVFGFLLVAASVLFALRPLGKNLRLVLTLGVLTTAAGLVGTVTGVCTSIRYISEVEPAQQFITLAWGVEESLHNAILALVLVLLGGIAAAVGAFRSSRAPEAA